MAADGERIATTGAVEKGEDKVIVTCLVDDLQVSGLVNKTVKNGSVSVTFGDSSLDMTAIVKGKNKETVFRKVVKKLPGPIMKDQCTWTVRKGKVIITLVKDEKASWAVQLSQRGLEQQSDEEDD
ncbi:uncharacterized protein LOC112559939 [Pomacea canaliculata]|uniref:uncharacterized protein LOC112559939 n=1 Tax=Pomacea canaliculata TaxID=400727 RepID=UPI000D726BB2|nr:uncharacterized protein LOC112559939 [Pomacea canaliculata]XP_025087233.1 uncharacterized protein LOC112559939 [Pomacea canaliculata]